MTSGPTQTGRQYRTSASKQATEGTTGSCRSKQATEATERRERRLGRQTMMATELEAVGSNSGSDLEQTEACPDSSGWESGLEWESGFQTESACDSSKSLKNQK